MLKDHPSERVKVRRNTTRSRSRAPARRKTTRAEEGAPCREGAGVGAHRRSADHTAQDEGESEAELEFKQALQNYKEQNGRMFPTWSEVLEVLRSLGYERTLSYHAERSV